MVSLEKMEMGTSGTPKKIKEFTVWWRTPVGLHDKLDGAIEACTRCDFDPERCIVAVPVAIAIDGDYEELTR